MNLLGTTLAPINGISAVINGGRGSLGAVVSDRGCPAKGQCKGCTPFCCFGGQEIGVFVQKTNIAEPLFNVAKYIVMGVMTTVTILALPVGAIAMAVVAIVDYLNAAAIKKSQKAYAEEHAKSVASAVFNQITTRLQTRLPWCDTIKWLQSSTTYFTANSPVFGADGPAVGSEFLKVYVLAALELNNERFGKTKQKIISAEPYQWDINEINLHKGVLMVKVPNIEHYWMGDIISLPGMSFPVTVIHRYGNSKMTTYDCDNVFTDARIFPDGLYESGSGCSMAYNANTLKNSQSSSRGGRTHGLNIRQMEGEGLLFCSIAYSEAHKGMAGGYVDLVNPVYITPEKQVIVPPKSSPNPSPSTNDPTTSKTSQIVPIKSKTALASFASPFAVIALVGIAAGFIYQTYKND